MLLEKALPSTAVVEPLVLTTQSQNPGEEWEWKQKMVKRTECDFGHGLCLTEYSACLIERTPLTCLISPQKISRKDWKAGTGTYKRDQRWWRQ